MKKILFIIAVIFIASSCSIFQPNKPKVMNYHKKIISTDIIKDKRKSDSLFKVSGFVLEPNLGSAKNLFDLSADGQSALIEAMSKSTKTTKELSSALAVPISEVNAVAEFKNYIIWRKKVVLNITKIDKDRANRLQYILLSINIPSSFQNKVEFVSWDKIVTETQSIDLGKITSGTKTALTFSPEITMAGSLVGTSAGSASVENTYGEEKSFTSKFAGLNAALVGPHTFEVWRQAASNEDISGNIVIELTLRSLKPKTEYIYAFTGLFDKESPVANQSNVKVTKIPIISPDFGESEEVPVDIGYTFRYRKVIGNSTNTEPEEDDEVVYKDGEFTETNKFKLFSDTDMKKYKMWEITDGKSVGKNYLHLFLNGEKQLLKFSSASEANQLLNWIKLTKNLKLADRELYLGIINKLTPANIADLYVAIEE